MGFSATYTVPALSGASIQATINMAYAAGSNNTVYLPAGIYNVSSALTLPCDNGLTVTGPVAAPATAILNATFSGNDIFSLSGCTGVTISYLQFRNTGGIYADSSSHSNITVTHNQFYGLPSTIGGGSNASAAVYLDGNLNNTVTNFTATWNTFGDSSSCTTVFTTTTDEGGYCAGIYAQPGVMINPVVQYNVFNHVEEGVHYHQWLNNLTAGALESATQNSSVQFNYFTNWHRIGIEMQGGVIGSAQVISDNSMGQPVNPSYGTMFISEACCTGGRTFGSAAANPANVTEDNLAWTDQPQQVGSFWAPVIGIEYWGGAGSRANGNYMMGNYPNQVTWGYGVAPWYITNNYLCAAHSGSYITQEEPSTSPVISGNTTVASCAQQTSTASTISPASGAYTSPPVITLSNSGRNTSTYYTIDGSTPVPGSGTTRLYTGPFAITLPVTVKAVGMWGVPPQPVSYPAPYGFAPSAVAQASYTATGGVVLSSVALANVGAVHTLLTGTSIQMTASCSYSDGSTTNCNTPDSHGNSVSSWASSNSAAVTINPSGLASGVAAGAANVTATVAGLTTPAWAIAVTAPSLFLNSVALATTGGVSTLVAGAMNQLVATCTYSDASTTACATPDAQGNVVTPWTSSAPAVASVNAAGVVTGQAAGSTNLTASVSTGVVTHAGATIEDTAGTTSPGYINATYVVLGNQTGGYTGETCSFFLPTGTLTVGAKYDCGLIAATSASTMAPSWSCLGTYTVTGAAAPNTFVTVPMSGCGTLAAGSAWWLALNTNQAGVSAAGFTSCGGAACAGAAPTSAGTGSYPCAYVAAPYGTYSGLTATLHTGGCGAGAVQSAQYVALGQPPLTSNAVPLTVTAATPTLVSAYLGAPGNSHALTVGGTLAMSAHCVYSDGSTTDCTVADIHGNAVSRWTSSDGTVVTIGAVASAFPGMVTAIAAGSASVQAYVGSVGSSLWSLTISNPAVTLTGLSLATTNGVTGLFVGSTNLLVATCLYSDGTRTVCNSSDSHGNVAGSYVSSAPAHATVNAVTGLVTAVAPGTTMLQASVGSLTSAAIPLTVLAVPSGTYTITISGPVSFSGRVQF